MSEKMSPKTIHGNILTPNRKELKQCKGFIGSNSCARQRNQSLGIVAAYFEIIVATLSPHLGGHV